MYDDIAYDEENPHPGVIINSPNGENVYKGVPKVFLFFNLFLVFVSYLRFSVCLCGCFYGRIIPVKMLLSAISLLLCLEISQLLPVGVGRLWIVVPMIIYLFTIVIMEVLECLVSDYYRVGFIMCFCFIMFCRTKFSIVYSNILCSNLKLCLRIVSS